jgi:hypothetical protein
MGVLAGLDSRAFVEGMPSSGSAQWRKVFWRIPHLFPWWALTLCVLAAGCASARLSAVGTVYVFDMENSAIGMLSTYSPTRVDCQTLRTAATALEAPSGDDDPYRFQRVTPCYRATLLGGGQSWGYEVAGTRGIVVSRRDICERLRAGEAVALPYARISACSPATVMRNGF